MNHLKFVFFFLFLLSLSALAEDTLVTVLDRMKPNTAARIIYHETRYLELLTDPWHGYGYVYAMPPDIMVKEQNFPNRELMGSSGKKLYYFDPIKNVRYSGALDNDDPISLNVIAFKALVNGDRALLSKLYKIAFHSGPERWMLTMHAKNKTARETLDRIEVSGPAAGVADKIEIFLVDGDRTVYKLKPDGEGEQLKSTVRQLHNELQQN